LSEPRQFLSAAVVRIPGLLADAILGLPAELANAGFSGTLAVIGSLASVLFALHSRSCMSYIPRAELAALRWLAPGAIAALLTAVGGFPGARELLVPNLGFAPIVACALEYGRAPGRFARARRKGVAALVLVHVALAPFNQIVTQLVARTMARSSEETARAIKSETHGDKRALILASSDPMANEYPAFILAADSSQFRACWGLLSAAPADLVVTRSGRSALTLEPSGTTFVRAAFETLYRAPTLGFHVGEEVVTCSVRVRVAKVQGGLPSRIAIESDADLDAPDTIWLAWRDGAMRRVTLPAIGEQTTIAWSPGPSGLY
jgi:hypothetical protein